MPVDPELSARVRNEAHIRKRLDGGQRRIRILVGPHAGVGLRLDRYLCAALPTFSRNLITGWLDHGWVRITGRDARPGTRVRAGDRIALHCPLPRSEVAKDPMDASPLDIRFHRAGILVVAKPPGMLAHQAGRRLSGTLIDRVRAWCREQAIDPSAARLFNRIDRDTSGLVLITLDAATHRALVLAQRAGQLRKEYLAITSGVPESAHGHWREPLAADPTGVTIARQIRPDGQPSHTEYQVLATSPAGCALLRCLLHTGRQHQIRAHAAHHGCPLVGDWVYGCACEDLPAQALHAAALEFPLGEACERVEAPLPVVLAALWARLTAGGRPTPRPLHGEERRRLGIADAPVPADTPAGWHRPSWLSDEEWRAMLAASGEDR